MERGSPSYLGTSSSYLRITPISGWNSAVVRQGLPLDMVPQRRFVLVVGEEVQLAGTGMGAT